MAAVAAAPRRGGGSGLRRPSWLVLSTALLVGVRGLVDESGRYRTGGDLSSLAPPEPSDEDRSAATDLSKQPVEKLFQLLSYELIREEKRPAERRLGIREFQRIVEASCPEKIVEMAQGAQQVSEEVKAYHLNITGTAGLYWMLHEYPEEHSWAWVIGTSHEKIMRKVAQHFSRLISVALDDREGCLTPSFRTTLMTSAATWRRLAADHVALLWNGIAFGILGDVTSWRDLDEEGQAANAPGGPPPNVSWSENLIFGNMWAASIQKFTEYHASEVNNAAYNELARMQAGMPPDPNAARWQRSEGGVLSSFEYLRRQLYGGWSLDKGLLRGFLRHLVQPGYGDSARPAVADFGAGGGRYSEWLNETGLVQAFAFDATHAVADITGGAVRQADLAAQDLRLFRTFDWVLCLDVAGHLAEEQALALLRNAARHAERGLVLSWSDPREAMPTGRDKVEQAEVAALVEKETGFRFDGEATAQLRSGCELPHLAAGAAVFRAPGAAGAPAAAAKAPSPPSGGGSWWR